MKHSLTILAGLACASAVAVPAHAEGPEMTFSAGADYSVGEYGLDTETSVIRIPFGVAARFDRLSLYAEIPWVSVEGPAGAGATSRLDGGSRLAVRRRTGGLVLRGQDFSASGIGDASVGGAFRLTRQNSDTYAGLFASATLPTGDEDEGLGAGQSDVTFGFDGEQRLDSAALMVSAGYVVVGDDDDSALVNEPGLFAADDFAFASIGARFDLADRSDLGVAIAWAQAAYEDLDDVVKLEAFGSRPLGASSRVGVYARTGLAGDGSDFAAGLTFSFFSS